MGKSVVSKETVALQKQLAEAYRRDMKAMVGKTYMITTAIGGDEDEDGVVQQEFVLVEKFDEDDGLIGTTVYTDEDSADVSIGTVIELNGEILQCSRNEFNEALKRAQRRIEKKLGAQRGEEKWKLKLTPQSACAFDSMATSKLMVADVVADGIR